MHALAAHGYHLLLRAAHVAALPSSRSLLAAFTMALAARMLGGARLAGPGAAVAVLTGWLVLAPLSSWPPPPVSRLSGLAALIVAWAALPACFQASRLAAPAIAASAAWWLCGMPADPARLACCLPVFLGLLAGLALARGLARNDAGWATLAAALTLAGSLRVAGASPHWAVAALAPAAAALAFMGAFSAMTALSGLLVCVAGTALVASDRGRLVVVDVACLLPLLAWLLVRRLATGSGPVRSAAASAFAALSCVLLAWATTRI